MKCRLINILALLFFSIYFFGCAMQIKKESRLMPTLPVGEDKIKDISTTILLLGDNQNHNNNGIPSLLHTQAVNLHTATAIRAPQQTLFGNTTLNYILRDNSELPVIHLGDALDISCVNEWTGFIGAMRENRNTWLMAPGNHDGYYFGNIVPSPDDFAYEWRGDCQQYDKHGKVCHANVYGTMDRFTFMNGYLCELAEKYKIEVTGFRGNSDVKRLVPSEASGLDNASFALEEVNWYVDRQQPWRSFIVQVVRIGRKESNNTPYAIIIDTNQYQRRPAVSRFIKTPGTAGSILEDQCKVIKECISEHPGSPIVIIGHHPIGKLDYQSKKRLFSLSPHFSTYISGHTHQGYNYLHPAPNNHEILEINVGSTVDYPVHYRKFTLKQITSDSPNYPGRYIVYSPVEKLTEEKFNRTDRGNTGWAVPEEGVHSHHPMAIEGMSADAEKSRRDVLKAQLLIYRDLIADFPTHLQPGKSQPVLTYENGEIEITKHPESITGDVAVLNKLVELVKDDKATNCQMSRFLIGLEDYDKNRNVSDLEMYERYKIYQMVWSARLNYERCPVLHNWIKPDVSYEYDTFLLSPIKVIGPPMFNKK